ncbi:hypothetical protein D1839_17540 [Roseburia sp. 1XD42-34]|nr:hypothetical protein [Roseburia sp. 1XD42-34]RKI74980.1 hypothetical protein D7V87_17620 [Clostridium sp. 1xD42-85]
MKHELEGSIDYEESLRLHPKPYSLIPLKKSANPLMWFANFYNWLLSEMILSKHKPLVFSLNKACMYLQIEILLCIHIHVIIE